MQHALLYLDMEHFSARHEPLMADLVADMTRQPSATTKEVWQLGFIPPAHLRLPWYDYGTAEESTTESRAAAHPSTPPPLYHSSLTINDEVRRPVSRSAAHESAHLLPFGGLAPAVLPAATHSFPCGSATRGSTPSVPRTDPRGVNVRYPAKDLRFSTPSLRRVQSDVPTRLHSTTSRPPKLFLARSMAQPQRECVMKRRSGCGTPTHRPTERRSSPALGALTLM